MRKLLLTIFFVAQLAFCAWAQSVPASSAGGSGKAEVVIRPGMTVTEVTNLISNQATPYGRSWTSYFVGQSKCWVRDTFCVRIQADGSLYIDTNIYGRGGRWYYMTLPSPFETTEVGAVNTCNLDFNARPIFNNFSGAAPTGWELVTGHVLNKIGCPSSDGNIGSIN